MDSNLATIFGYRAPEELVGQNVKMLMPSPYREQHDAYLLNFAQTHVAKMIGTTRKVEAVHRDGSVFQIDLSVMMTTRANKQQVYVASIQQTVCKTVNMLVSLEGAILSVVNSERLGYAPATLIGKNIAILVPSPWKRLHDTYMRSYLETNKSEVVGKMRILPLELATKEVVSVSLLVSKLQVESGYLVTIDKLDNTPELIFTLSSDGTIESCNSTFVKPVLGYTLEEITGMSINKIVPNLFKHKAGSSVVLLDTKTNCEASYKDGSCLIMRVIVHMFMVPTGVLRYSCHLKFCSWQQGIRSSTDETEEAMSELANHFDLGIIIGRGAFGVVRIATHQGELCAVKMILKGRLDAKALLRVKREVAILERLDHPHLIRLHRVVETSWCFALGLEFCAGGEMFQYLQDNGHLQEEESCRYFKQLLYAVKYLHSLDIVHRDIKLENILFIREPVKDWWHNSIKLIDFGLSRYNVAQDMLNTFCGTPAYAAPEVITASAYSGWGVDVWSCGVVLFFMLTGKLPFSSMLSITSCHFEVDESVICEVGRNLFDRIFQKDPNLRITISGMLEHPWVTKAFFRSKSDRFVQCIVLDNSAIGAVESVLKK